MKVVLGILMIVSFLVPPVHAGEVWSLRTNSTPFDRSLLHLSFEKVDFSALRFQVEKRKARLSVGDCNRLLTRNLAHIFHNCLNRNHFLVAPDPQLVVDRITAIYKTRDRVQSLLSKSRNRFVQKELDGELAGLVAEIGIAASDLRENFSGYFLEAHDSVYSIRYPVARDDSVLLASFLVESSKISTKLTRQLDFYFLNASPGAISLADYQRTSIVVLSEALQKLSEMVSRSIR